MSRAAEIVRLLDLAADYRDPNADRRHITGQQHALRCAALMARYTDELAFVGLVHDLARPLSDPHHGEVIAEIVRDRVSLGAYDVLRTHGEYQAALTHGHAFPSRHDDWSRTARLFAAAEVHSFRDDCPALGYDDAVRLLRAWLD